MANTEYGVNHPLARKAWAKKLYADALKATFVGRFIGESSNSLIQKKSELGKNKGDKVTIGLRMQMNAAGQTGDATLEGNEEALTTYSDAVLIDQMRHATRSAGMMTEQRVPFSVRDEGKMGLEDWFADKFDTAFFNHICGNTGAATGNLTGANATVAPSATRAIYVNADAGTTEASLSTTDVFQLTHIDRALANMKVASPTMRPIRVNGGEYYVAFLHPYQVYSLRTDATAARVTWYDTQKALVQGGQSAGENGIFTGALGMYNGVILHEATRVPVSPTKANVYRAVVCGAQAVGMAFGAAYDGLNAKWTEKFFDYENQLGIAGAMIYGMKKTVFNSVDFGTFVIGTYAAAP